MASVVGDTVGGQRRTGISSIGKLNTYYLKYKYLIYNIKSKCIIL